METIQRYGYINTRSSKGAPASVELLAKNVLAMRSWVNQNGNPSYTYLVRQLDGSLPYCTDTFVLYSVDDYGAENNLGNVTVKRVGRKADLFAGWV